MGFGKYLIEGQDVFCITEEMLDALPTLQFEFDYCLVEKYMSEPDGDRLMLSAGNYNVWGGDEDQHSSESASDLLENYG